VGTLVQVGSTRSIVRGSSGLGWLIAPARDRWMIWLQDGAHALLSVERETSGSLVRVDLVTAELRPFVEVSLPGTFPELDAALLEEVVQAAVAGDLPFEPAYRSAWAIAIRTTAQDLRTRLGA
jgi:hypothetical protein